MVGVTLGGGGGGGGGEMLLAPKCSASGNSGGGGGAVVVPGLVCEAFSLTTCFTIRPRFPPQSSRSQLGRCPRPRLRRVRYCNLYYEATIFVEAKPMQA